MPPALCLVWPYAGGLARKNTQNGKLALDGKAEMLNNGCVA
jgi:hypothetical protein